MKSTELRKLNDADLSKKLDELKAELFNLRFQHAINQLDNPLRIKDVKRDIARVLTEIRARELSAEREAK
jgi:large subunit ribosomal protein L29